MWDEQKREQFQTLRKRELEGVLTDAEQVELSQMIQGVESAEAAYLRPATERLRREREQVEVQNRALQALAQRKGTLVARLGSVLAELEAERQAIDEELVRIFGEGVTGETGVTG